ncbi:MAG TPA: UvrB/UvrC motif-containing protein [Candidatus Saccharimonas sp.]|jgi:excinuclease ABC subunit C|nr:UvrB/UvrC motif-containing protein [Candidatus Saccharimonas sp.]
MNEMLSRKLESLPRSPGVYFHKSLTGEIIYIGKAAVLRNRVRQYFQSTRDFDQKTLALVAEIADTDWVETESEIDALFLESEMVKRYMPRYNILLRDDKSQLFVRIDMKSEWPHVATTRNPADDGATYIGPFYNGYAVKKALRYLRKVFPYYTKAPAGGRPDLDVHLGLSPKSDTTSAEYRANLKKLIKYIKGGRISIVREIERDMKRAARQHEFETAAVLRNRLGYLSELQRRIMFGDKEFLDISKDQALVKLTELLELPHHPTRIEAVDISHTSGTDVVASLVVFVNGVSSRSDYRKFKMTQQRNDDYEHIYETVYRRFSEKNVKAWGMPDLLLVDGGKGQLSSALDALDARGVEVPCIGVAKREEVLIVNKSRSHIKTDNLAQARINPVAGLYVEDTKYHYEVNLHPGQQNAGSHSRNLRGGTVSVSPYRDITLLVQRIRDEAHRFAISYHTSLRRSGQTKSKLDDIPGIGPVLKKRLLTRFGSARGVYGASHEQLAGVVGQICAQRITEYVAHNGH